MTKIHRPFDTWAMMVFIQAARAGSFTIAGERMGLTPSAVSKIIARLEDELGAQLLHRTPRSVTLTTEGTKFFDEAERLTVSIERARNVVSDRAAMPREKLRVSVPINFGRAVIAPHLPLFVARHPELDIDYLLTNAQTDPIEHRIDVALWIDGGAWVDSRLVIQNLAVSGTLLCAAPSYLEKFGAPRRIADLAHHRTLAAVDEQTGQVWPWHFENGETRIPYFPRNGFHSNGIEVLYEMAIQGSGIAYLPDYIAAESIREGKLRIVLPKFRLVPSAVRIIYPRSHLAKPGVMAFVALLSEIIETQQGRLA